MSKKVKCISAINENELEKAINDFFENGDLRWKLVAVTSGPGYRSAWLEFEDVP